MSQSLIEKIFHVVITVITVLCGCIFLGILVFVGGESLPFFREIGFYKIISDNSWHPMEGLYNLVPMLVGSLLLVLGTMILVLPLSLCIAVFRYFYAHKVLNIAFKSLLELSAGVPSVVYGFFGLAIIVPWINRYQPPGAGFLAGMIVLTVMVLPTMTLIIDHAFMQTPLENLKAAHALGLPKISILRASIFPFAKPAIFTSMLLAATRIIGETMAVLMVTGNIVQIPSTFWDPMRAITANIALEMSYANGPHRSVLYASGLILLLVTSLIFLCLPKLQSLSNDS